MGQEALVVVGVGFLVGMWTEGSPGGFKYRTFAVAVLD